MSEILDTGTTGKVGNEKLPNSTGVLVLGIISIVLCGLIGLICGIIALSMASAATRLYNENPMRYDEASFKQMKAGKVCAIIGLSLLGFVILLLIVILGLGSL